MNQTKAYDLSFLSGLMENDKEAILNMVNIFLDSTPQIVAELNKHYQDGNMKELGKSAHKLKSSIDLFKVNSLHQDIRTLLELGRSNKQNDSIPGL